MLYSLIVDTWYVCIPAIFVLAVLDPVLTVLSYRRYRRTLAKRVDMERFELNPRWQKAVKAGRFLPLPYVIRVAVSTGVLLLLFFAAGILGPDPSPRAALVGYLLCTYLVIDLNHLGNLRSFGMKPAQPEGSEEKPKVKLGYSYSLGLTQVSYETTFLLLFVLWLLAGGYFLFGAAAAPAIIAYRLRFMRANALRKEDGLPPRNYRKLRLAILFIVIVIVLVFVQNHRNLTYYGLHVEEGNRFFAAERYRPAALEYLHALDYVPDGEEAFSGLDASMRLMGYEKELEPSHAGNPGSIPGNAADGDDLELEMLKRAWRRDRPGFFGRMWRSIKSMFTR